MLNGGSGLFGVVEGKGGSEVSAPSRCLLMLCSVRRFYGTREFDISFGPVGALGQTLKDVRRV